VLRNLGFEDCWVTAVMAVNSREISLQDSRIHGSTFGFLAIATEGMEADAHTYRILGNRWLQSPAAYRPDAVPCARPHLDLTCAVDVWGDLPWGIAHHHLWRTLNGAFFAAYNVAGNVLVADNTLERAYNGVRIIAQRPGTGRNVEIRGNHFRFLRDNAVEPEDSADGWVVKHNVFENVHAWIGTDGVRGGAMYVFGNLGWYDPDHMPGETCRDDVDWSVSPRLMGLAGDKGRYVLVDESDDPTSIACRGHSRGVILKTGDKRKLGFPYFERISIFNNSWRTRSPLFSSKHASPLSHFNNAVAFTGCGLDGPWNCRQVPAPLEECRPGNRGTRGRVALNRFWTRDGDALVADCFSVTPGPAEPDERVATTRHVEHVFCSDLYNRAVDGMPYPQGRCAPAVQEQVFATQAGVDLSLRTPMQGCLPTPKNDAVFPDCDRSGPLIGAMMADGSLYDLSIPGAGFQGANFRP